MPFLGRGLRRSTQIKKGVEAELPALRKTWQSKPWRELDFDRVAFCVHLRDLRPRNGPFVQTLPVPHDQLGDGLQLHE